LGDTQFDTLLQGSYRTGTALHDINDVDILVICIDHNAESLRSGDEDSWERFFRRLTRRLQSSHHYAGKSKRGDKCIRLMTSINVDLVPAVSCAASGEDPIFIYSRRSKTLKRNWPRGHYLNTTRKNDETKGAFLPAVRLFKRWVRCVMPTEAAAPSYYVQCLLHSLPAEAFSGDLAADFVAISHEILRRHGGVGGYRLERLPRTNGSGDLFTDEEWKREDYLRFEGALRQSLGFAKEALILKDHDRARTAWRKAFGDYAP
jgi:hypothetical protein